MNGGRCTSTATYYVSGEAPHAPIPCILGAGHKGPHSSRTMTWTDPERASDEARDIIAALLRKQAAAPEEGSTDAEGGTDG